MNWGELQARVMESIGAVAGELDDEVQGWCEDALDDIHSEGWWPWLRDSSNIQYLGMLSGTCTYTQGATSVLLDTGGAATAPLAALYVGGLVELGGESVYEVTAYDQGTQTLTLASGIVEATQAAASGAYQLIQDTISLPSDIETVLEVHDDSDAGTLELLAGNKRRRLWPNPFEGIGGIPVAAWVRGVDSSGNVRMGVYPPPDTTRSYRIEYWKRSVYPTSAGEELEAITGIPRRFHPVVLARAKAKAYEFEDENDTKRALAETEYLRGIKRMKSFSRTNAGAIRQFRSDRVNQYVDPDAHTEITGV